MGLLQRKKSYTSAPAIETGAWTTEHELLYLKGIGSHNDSGERCPLRRKIELLRNYVLAANLRFDWCGMDKGKILRAARHQLLDLEMQIG